MFRAVIVFISILLALGQANANDSAKESWIIGSYVNVRSQPSRSAEIVEHLVANTPVNLLSQQEDFCEITWGNNRHGFLACKLLGDKVLRIEDIGAKPKFNEKPNPQYSPLRAFWIEPTVERLFDAGEHFRKVMMPAEQLRAENCFWEGCFDEGSKRSAMLVAENDQRGSYVFKRFSIPEFDAMKKLMADGIIAPHSQYALPTAWKKIQTIIKNPDASYTEKARDKFNRITPHLWLSEPLDYIIMFKKVSLSKSKPSFFKNVDEIGRPSAGAEELSAQYQIPHKTIVLDKPMWGGDNNSYPILMGAWDIGKMESRLTRSVYEVAIGIDGTVSIGETDAATQRLRNEETCDGAFELGSSKNSLPGYKQVKQPWIFFRLATLPTLTKAKVTIKKFSSNVDKINGTGLINITTLLRGNQTTARVDLDADGVDDLFVWDDGGNGIDDLGYERKRLIFANVAGQWYLLDTDDEHACGC
jgi:hypothetical protein